MSLTERQLALRRTGIGGSDLPAILGIDAHGRTEHDVYASKVLGVDNFEETEAIELGNELEPIVIPRLARKVGLHALRVDPETLTAAHPRCAWHIATPDALLAPTAFNDPEATAQIKVCGVHTARHWGPEAAGADGLPDHVLVQALWEAYCRELPSSYVGALIGTKVHAYHLVAIELVDLLEVCVEAVDRFWTDHVVSMRPPPIDGSKASRRMLAGLFPRNRGTLIRASPEAEEAARAYFAFQRDARADELNVEGARQALIAACGDADGIDGDGWRLRLKWREPIEVKAYTREGYRHFDCREKGI